MVERHKATGKTGVGVVSGFGIQGGAIASSVSHDSHNIIVIGDNDEDMYLAVQELIRTQGGYTLVADHHVYDTLELPIMGLMSDAGFQYSHRKLERMIPQGTRDGCAGCYGAIYHSVLYGSAGHSRDTRYSTGNL